MFTPIRTDRSGIDSNIYNICMRNVYMNYLLENAHICYIFQDCIYDIINQKFSKEYQYSGWCFDNKNYRCIKSNKECYHPIYIKEINDINRKNIFSIIDRIDENTSDTDIIYITKNNNNKIGNIGGLSHEFCHMIEMYIIDKNTIKHENLNSVLDNSNINKVFLEKVKDYKYLLLPSEQKAFLHATIYELSEFKRNNRKEYKEFIKKYVDTENIISEMITKTFKYNKMNDINKILDYLNEDFYRYNSYYFLVLLYFLYHEGKSNNISINTIINFNDIDNEYAKKIAEKMLDIIEKNKDQYHKKLQDAIYNHILFDYNYNKKLN